MKIAVVVGARPQFIKAAVISRVFRECYPSVEEYVIHTGQHYDANMSEVFFGELDIPEPNCNLGVGGGSHGQNTGRMIERIEEILISEKPAQVLVYGDTDSTLAGTLAAVKLHIPIAHVEAGLRSFNRYMPEEINRVLTDHAADALFTPTDAATRNLNNEGISGERVQQVGDVMYDAALYYGERVRHRSQVLDELGLGEKSFVLATMHRAENTDQSVRISGIVEGLAASPYQVLWPMHPRARRKLAEFGVTLPGNIHVIEPVGYLDMLMLERDALVIATDSGGVQKEAYFHRTPCVTLREETEWIELIDAGCNRLVGAESDAITQAIAESGSRTDWHWNRELYGGGEAGVRIARRLVSS